MHAERVERTLFYITFNVETKKKKGAKRPEVFMFLALEFFLFFTEVEFL